MPSSKCLAVAVDAGDQELVAEDPFEVYFGAVDGDVAITAGDAGPDEGAVVGEDVHGLEADVGVAGGLEDEVGLSDVLRELVHGGFAGADVGGAIGLDDLGLAVGSRAGGEGVDLKALEAEHHGGEQSDLAGTEDEGALRLPDLEALLGEEGLFDGLGANAGGLGEDAEMA